MIARNCRNTALRVIVFVLFIGLLVGVLGAGLLDAGVSEVLRLAVIGSGGAVLVATWSYYGGGAAILGMSGARKVSRDKDSQLHNVVDELAIAAGVPVPAVYLIDDAALNAFATPPGCGSVCRATSYRPCLRTSSPTFVTSISAWQCS